MNNYQKNSDKKIEETKKEFEKMFGGTCSYHEEDNWGRTNGIFSIKLGNNKKLSESNVPHSFEEVGKLFEGVSHSDYHINTIIFRGMNSQENFVISGKFKNFEIEKQKNELIEEGVKENKNQVDKPGENLNRHFIDNGNSLTYSTERRDKDKVIKETYYEPRGEEEKNQIIEWNKAQQEKEKSQFEDSENKPVKTEELIQSDKNQASAKDKNSDFSLTTKIAIGSGIVLVPVVLVGIVRKWKNK